MKNYKREHSILLTPFTILCFLVLTSINAGNSFAAQNAVSICHVSDGNPHTIMVNTNAVDAHLAHGDTVGACNMEPPICGPGTEACGTTCNDLSTDENNCGACGFMCPNETQCINASCVQVCDQQGCEDADGDGVISASSGGPDCNDNNPEVFPSHEEVCDFLDNDCNGVVDDRDLDQDGHIDVDCLGSYSGLSPADDCRDTNDGVHAAAPELCGDSFDNNCDGFTNEGCP